MSTADGIAAEPGAAAAPLETPPLETPLLETPLTARHVAAGARMVPFAGYAMPLQYDGIIAEHTATRERAGVFDVSHMGQIDLAAPSFGDVAGWLERLVPSDIAGLADGQARYTVLTNADGGVVDDLIVTRVGEGLRLVVNGARKGAVAAHFSAHADEAVSVDWLGRALVAVQGPAAEAALKPHVAADIAALRYMTAAVTTAFGADALVSRSGYTGEDGFELSLPAEAAGAAWDTLVAAGVTPVGLGARDSLRLEAGLCLYGQDLTEAISPIEAGLTFIVPRRRRMDGGFLGEERVLAEIRAGVARQRIGLAVEGRVPARAGAEIVADGLTIGTVTSGGVGPTVGAPVAMGYVAPRFADTGTRLAAIVRGKPVPLVVTSLPFVPSRTKRTQS